MFQHLNASQDNKIWIGNLTATYEDGIEQQGRSISRRELVDSYEAVLKAILSLQDESIGYEEDSAYSHLVTGIRIQPFRQESFSITCDCLNPDQGLFAFYEGGNDSLNGMGPFNFREETNELVNDRHI